MLVRFLLGAFFLFWLPRGKPQAYSVKEEAQYGLAGFLGVFLYYWLENLATNLTHASNVAIIVTTIPFLSSLPGLLHKGGERIRITIYLAMAVSFGGVLLIVLSSSSFEGVSPQGDLLAFGAATAFALYTNLLAHMNHGGGGIGSAKKILMWGTLWIVLASFLSNDWPQLNLVLNTAYLFHFGFLGLFASGLCFVLWNKAVMKLGPVATSRYIFLVPVISTVLSFLVLGEDITLVKLLGMTCIITGAVWNGRIPRSGIKIDSNGNQNQSLTDSGTLP